MRIISFDIESPDGQFLEGNICEFGYALSDSYFNVIKKENLLIHPRLPFVRLNHRIKLAYSIQEYNHAPTFFDQSDKITELLSSEDTLVIGHAIHNDIMCIRNAYRESGLVVPNFYYLDTQMVFSLFRDEKNIVSLDNIAAVIGIDFIHHRADEDALLALKTLEFVCNQLSCSVRGLIDKYNIQLGRTENGNIFNMCTPYFAGSAPSPSSKNCRKKLLAHFIENVKPKLVDLNNKHELYGKKIAFNRNLEIEDINKMRCIIQKIADVGGVYVRHGSLCDIFVTNEEDDDGKISKRSVSQDKFLEILGDLPEVVIDDMKVLEDMKNAKMSRNKTAVNFN